jgi:hypothetical protein
VTQEVDGDEVPPWERPGAARRDCEPDRSWLLKPLGKASLVLGTLSVCVVLPGVPGFAVGVTTCVLAQRDLARMQKGLMDPAGEEATRRARGDAVEGIVLSLGSLAFWGTLLLFAFASISLG